MKLRTDRKSCHAAHPEYPWHEGHEVLERATSPKQLITPIEIAAKATAKKKW
eukprot:CAMPEP_0178432002 /NCGR_PEP_ID=MMETSP0689_2-20121128/32153_1 /TAXON_ID=160604 /ORGANISM="Amphidinium massartii, Strain CS-259" /LENGTH=51 /DNA_ID=CAMNT_0020053961 /DNA_START=186 /DNA_END=338 /DNA_ORIENTATION=+